MDPTEMRYLEEEDGAMMKTIKGAVTGFATGTIYGTVVATWKDVPRVERHVALPGLIRTLKMMGSHGLTFAAIGGIFIGVEQLVHNFRAKRDFFNGAIGGFAAGASVLGYKALAVTSALIDSGGQDHEVTYRQRVLSLHCREKSCSRCLIFPDDDEKLLSRKIAMAKYQEPTIS